MITTPDIFQYIYGLAIFISIFVLFSVAFIKNRHQKFLIVLSVILLISVIVGVRGEAVGLDSTSYMNFFRGDDSKVDEPFFYLIRWLSLNNSDIGFLMISILTNVLFLLAFRRFGDAYPVFIAIYLCTFIFINLNINIVRQGLSMAFFAYAVSMLLDFSYKRFCLYGIMSILVHFSAIIPVLCLGLIVWSDNRFISPVKVILLLLPLFLMVNLSQLIAPLTEYSEWINKLYWYLSWDRGKVWSFKHIYYLILLLLVVGWFVNQKQREKEFVFGVFRSFVTTSGKNRYSQIWNNGMLEWRGYSLSFVSVLAGYLLVFIFRQEEMVADRIFYYFLFFIPMLIWFLVSRLQPKTIMVFTLLFGVNIWFFKSIVVQFSGWFIPPYMSIRF